MVRIRDARGESGRLYAYRLTFAPPRPDFELFVSPSNPNVPRGGRVPVMVTAYRHDGFDAAIEVSLEGLPAGVTAEPGTILRGHSTVAITLAAAPDAAPVTAPLVVKGRAVTGTRQLVRQARADEKVSVVSISAPPDVRVVAVEPADIELAPGGHAKVRATIARENGFTGRVPLAVLKQRLFK